MRSPQRSPARYAPKSRRRSRRRRNDLDAPRQSRSIDCPREDELMTVYVVALLNIADRAGYQTYTDGFMDIFSKYAGQVLAVDESPRVIEGEWPHSRTVLISF